MSNNKYAGKKCFVIMPFGKKKDVDGTDVDFDFVYNNLIKAAVESIDMACERCDEIIDTGSIHFKMFHGIFEADVAVVDITSLNANVFYELGIRHALNKCVTLVIRRNVPQPPPFNINGLNVVGYDLDTEEKREASRQKIGEYVRTGMDKQSVDSLVHQALDNLNVERKAKAIEKKEEKLYNLINAPGKQIGFVTGDIQNIKNVDVWVNSENTNMMMARYFERSISATIRYKGAKKDRAGRVVEDLIANDLREAVGTSDVAPATVIHTTSGELLKTNNVKKIFHAASVMGQPGRGYVPIADIAECIRNALRLADSDEMANEDIRSIIFPLMGTGTTKLSAQSVADKLIDEAVAHMEDSPQSKVNKVYFLVYNEQDREICRHKFINDPRIATPGETETPA